MYKIIGGDQKPYGPITAEQLREWYREGRVNAQTAVLVEGTAQWTTLSALPEFADLFGVTVAEALPGAITAMAPETILGRDYNLDIGDCISRAWELVKANFWPVLGVSLLIYIVIIVLNQILGLFTRPIMNDMILNQQVSPQGIAIVFGLSILFAPVSFIFTAGLFKYYLRLIRGEEATVADAFSGFKHALQLALLAWVANLLVWVGLCFCILPGIYLSIAWYFSIPLVIDRGLGFWEAMELSRKVVSKHWFIVFAFFLVVGLLAFAGVFACCIGILVTAPIASVAMMYAYEDIFVRPSA